jgi:hypothetical protein
VARDARRVWAAHADAAREIQVAQSAGGGDGVGG